MNTANAPRSVGGAGAMAMREIGRQLKVSGTPNGAGSAGVSFKLRDERDVARFRTARDRRRGYAGLIAMLWLMVMKPF